MLFSGLRSALLLFFIFALFEVVNSFVKFKQRIIYLIFGPLVVCLVILSLNLNSIVKNFASNDDSFLSALIAKSTFNKASKIEAGDQNYRTWLWEQHLAIYSNNPLFGVGSYKITDYVQYDIYGKDKFEGSESFLTRWLARAGLPVLLIVFFLGLIYMNALRKGNKYTYLLPIFVFILMLIYGSFLMPYNFMYIMVFATINYKELV